MKNVYINFNQPNQKKLEKVTVSELEKYISEGQFAAGSMLPKVKATIDFVKASGKSAVITSLDGIDDFINNNEGTIITND